MPATTSRRSNGSRRERILNYLSSQGGRIDSVDGRGLTSKMATRVGYDNIAALNAILARLERDGEINRVVRGKRTYSIALRGRAGRPAAGRPAGGRAVAASSSRTSSPRRAPGTRRAAGTRRASTPRAGSSPRAASSPRGAAAGRRAAGSRRAAAGSAPNRARRRSAPASGGSNLPQLLAALGNELLTLRAQNEDITRRIAALESAVRPASRRGGSRRVA